MDKQKYSLIAILCTTVIVLQACTFSNVAAPKATETPTLTSTPIFTSTPAYTATPEFTATKTPRPPRPSPTPNLTATKQSEDMAAKVKEYYQAKYVSTDKGTSKRLEAFVDSWAQIDWYQWNPVARKSPNDFIIRSNIKWESASRTANDSGCGYVFRAQEDQDHYMVYISIDGNVYASIVSSGYFQNMGRGHYGKASPDGRATVTLIVEGSSFTVLIDDKFIKRFEGMKNDMLSGDLAYTTVSGTQYLRQLLVRNRLRDRVNSTQPGNLLKNLGE